MGLTTQQYDIVTRIAIGNGALVYRAVEKSSLRQVALKLLMQEGEVDHRLDLDALFEAAPRIKQITGSHVCQLLDAYRDDDGPVLVYEFANGINGSDFPHGKKLTAAQGLDVAAQLISSLRSGERQRTPHGDLKPSNIIFVESPEGRPYTFVLDWGLAAFRSATPEDSLPFFAPERLEGAPESHPADLFSAGAVMFYLLTGKLLVSTTSREKLPQAWKEARPEVLAELRPDLAPKFVQWICSLLALDLAKRPPSAVEAGTILATLNPPPPLVAPETIRPRPAQRSTVMPAQSGITTAAQSSHSIAPVPTPRQTSVSIAPAPEQAKKTSVMMVTMISLLATMVIGAAWWFFIKPGSGNSVTPESPGSQSVRPAPTSVTAPLPPRQPAEIVGPNPPQVENPQPPKPVKPPPPTPQIAQPSTDPAILLVEAFDYPRGSLITGHAGGVGWGGPWQGKGARINPKSLEFPKHPSTGGMLNLEPSKGEHTWTRRAGPLSLFVPDPSKGDRWYLGMLIQHGDGTPAPNGEMQINPFDTADPFNLIRFIVEDRGTTLRISLNDTKVFLEVPDDGKPVHVLTRITLDKPKLGNWDIEFVIWINPDFNAANETSAGSGLAGKLVYAAIPAELGLLIRSKQTQSPSRIDEIRVGRNFETMVFKPAPQPKRAERK